MLRDAAVQAKEGFGGRGHLPDHEGYTYLDIARVLRRRKATIVWTVVIVSIGHLLYGLSLTPRYSAAVSILVEPQETRSSETPNGSGVIALVSLDAEAELIRSERLAAKVVEQLGLLSVPEFQPESGLLRSLAASALGSIQAASIQPILSELSMRASSLAAGGAAAGDGVSAGESGGSSTPGSLEAAKKAFADRLRVSHGERSNVLRVEFTSSDPKMAATVANSVAETYIGEKLRTKLSRVQRAKAWLDTYLPLYQQSVLQQDEVAAGFRSTHKLLSAKGSSLTESELQELHRALIEARSAEVEKRARLRVAGKLSEGGSDAGALAEVLASPLISALRRQEAELLARQAELATAFGPAHPRRQALGEELSKVGARLQEEVGRIVQALENDIEILAARKASLAAQIEAASIKHARDNQAIVRLQEMERGAAAARSRYEVLLARHQQTSGQEELLEPDARIISPAEPPLYPATPSAPVLAGAGVVAATVLGSVLAFAREHSDRRFRSARQLERSLQVPCLGLVPNVGRRLRRRALHEHLRGAPMSAYAQAVKALFVRLTAVRPTPKVLLVSSALPSEGKSALAAALAACAAQISGSKTLLVDFDLWRPQQAEAFRMKTSPGVAELIVYGEPEGFGVSIRSVPHASIDVLPAGDCAEKAAHILTTDWVGRFIAALKARYDLVVIDSPPILGVNDGRLLARFVDATVLAVRWGHTPRDAAIAAIRALEDASANIAGVVMTRVDAEKHAFYGEGEDIQFHRKFRKYYESRSEAVG